MAQYIEDFGVEELIASVNDEDRFFHKYGTDDMLRDEIRGMVKVEGRQVSATCPKCGYEFRENDNADGRRWIVDDLYEHLINRVCENGCC